MLNEQIRQEIEKQVDEKISKSLEVFNLPLISTYKVLCFNGRADGTDLTLTFPIGEILQRTLTIKSFKIVPYYFGIGNDIWLFDGVTNVVEATYANQRINRLFDDFVAGTLINFFINGVRLSMFPVTGVLYPLDMFLDNIFYKFPEKIETIRLQVTSSVINDLTTGALVAPNVKVVIECYTT